MFARYGEVTVKPGKLDEFVKVFHGDMVPQARTQKGFKGITVLTDPAANRAILISFWESEAAARAVEQTSGAFQNQVNKVAELIEKPPQLKYLAAPVREM